MAPRSTDIHCVSREFVHEQLLAFSKRPRKKQGGPRMVMKMVVSKTSTTTGRRRRYPEANHVCVVRRTGVQSTEMYRGW
jgi:hypothetical protein